MHGSKRTLFRDVEFKVTSNFIVEVEESEDLIVIYPSEIVCKCIHVSLSKKAYFCLLPYRIYDD